MAEIMVFFPESGPPVVTPDIQAVCQEELINWIVLSQNRVVKEVKIGFTERDARFFPITMSSPVNSCSRKLYECQNINAQFPWCGTMWGLAPYFKEDGRKDKYTVYAYSSAGEEIEELRLDPIIITRKP
ncbi:MAG: hypothetical protein GY716_16320 [bacterium]|nr:hypothetical protein [bacterium]